jgi:FAD synthase
VQLEAKALAGGVIALGKFDALHVGHRALAERAAELGVPFLVSFAGMAQVLGWEVRLPVVAPCDRTRVMGLWAKYCGDVVPREYMLDFAKVRSLSPEQFVAKLAFELKVKGVVAGANYRFGYKAAGDASDLVRLCQVHGLQSAIVNPVMDAVEVEAPVLVDDNSREKGQVSTTRVREALANGDMKRVAELLGRSHRLIIRPDDHVVHDNVIALPMPNALNQPPRVGSYKCNLILESSAGVAFESRSLLGHAKIEDDVISVALQEFNLHLLDTLTQQRQIVLDFLE